MTGTEAETALATQCTSSGVGSVSSRAITDFTGSDDTTMIQRLEEIVVDSYHKAIYVIIKEYLSTDETLAKFYLTKIPAIYDTANHLSATCTETVTASCVNMTDWTRFVSHEFTTTIPLFTFDTIHRMIFIDANKQFPYVMVAGTLNYRVRLTKIFLPTAHVLNPSPTAQFTIREVFSFTPGFCGRVPCEKITQMLVRDNWLYVAIQTHNKAEDSRGVVCGRVFITAVKETSKFAYKIIEDEQWLGKENGIGFMVFDQPDINDPIIGSDAATDRLEHLYLGLRSQTPSAIRKISSIDLSQQPPTYQGNYENVITSYQVAVAATVHKYSRVLYVVLKLPRLQVLLLNLYDLESINPNVVDGTGGTIVLVRGKGFPNSEPHCKFGTHIVSGSRQVTLVNDTTVMCVAPKVPNYDSCRNVPLEISFGSTNRFTANGIMVRHIDLPIVTRVVPDRGFFIQSEIITVHGTGFLNSAYVKCTIGGIITRGTWLSSSSMKCEQPVVPKPIQTTVEVSMDGQKFSQSNVVYYILGLPKSMRHVIKSCKTGTCPDWIPQSSTDLYSEVSDVITTLNDITVKFYDEAGSPIGIRDDLVRGGNVTLNIIKWTNSPLGSKYDGLQGTLSQPIENGEVTFNDIYIQYPGAGKYTLGMSYTAADDRILTEKQMNATEALQSATFDFSITAVATRLSFITPPTYFSSNKEQLTSQPVIKFSDVSENIVTTASGKISVEVLLDNKQTLRRIIKTIPPPCQVDCVVYVAMPGSTELSPPYLGGHLNSDVEFKAGVITFKTLRIFEAAEGYNYTLRFRAMGIPNPIDSVSVNIAVCHSSSNAAIYQHIPDNGQLGSQLVTIKGWGFRESEKENMFCKYGSDPKIKAKFIDTCTMLCPLRAKKGPRSDALEIAYSANMAETGAYSALNINYTYTDVIESLTAVSSLYEYPSAGLVVLDPITIHLRDGAGSWLRTWDTENRVVFLKTRLPLTATVLSFVTANSTLTISGLQAKLPKKETYSILVTTRSTDPLPTDTDNVELEYDDKAQFHYLNTRTQSQTVSYKPIPTSTETPTVIDNCNYPLNCSVITICDVVPTGISCAADCNCQTEQACVNGFHSSPCIWKDSQCRKVLSSCKTDQYVCQFQRRNEVTETFEKIKSITPLVSPDCQEFFDMIYEVDSSCVMQQNITISSYTKCLQYSYDIQSEDISNTYLISYHNRESVCLLFTGSCVAVSSSGWNSAKAKCHTYTNSISLPVLYVSKTVSKSLSIPTFTISHSGSPTVSVTPTYSLTESESYSESLSSTLMRLDETISLSETAGDGNSEWGSDYISLPASDECIPTSSPCLLMHDPKPSSFFVFRSTFKITITAGNPMQMKFFIRDGSSSTEYYSSFTTSRRKLDIQPVIRIVDISDNTVTVFKNTPVIRAVVVPICVKGPLQSQDSFDFDSSTTTPPGGCLAGSFLDAQVALGVSIYAPTYGPYCHGTRPSSVTKTVWESQCTRVKGDNERVINGVAMFQDLYFRGSPIMKYEIQFSVGAPLLPVLKTGM